MPPQNKIENYNIKKAVELLKLSLSLEDEELLKSSIEAVIELLDDELHSDIK